VPGRDGAQDGRGLQVLQEAQGQDVPDPGRRFADAAVQVLGYRVFPKEQEGDPGGDQAGAVRHEPFQEQAAHDAAGAQRRSGVLVLPQRADGGVGGADDGRGDRRKRQMGEPRRQAESCLGRRGPAAAGGGDRGGQVQEAEKGR